MDGYLKIKTKIDNKNVDKDIRELENKIKKLQEDNSKNNEEQSFLQKEINDYKILQEKADEYKNTITKLNQEKQNMFSNNLLNNERVPEYQRLVSELDMVKTKYAETTNEIDKQAPKIEKVYSKLSKIKAKQTENNTKISQFKQKIDQINLNKVQSSLNSVGKNLQKQIGSLSKITISIFGIRTGINAVRSAISLVSQYNDQVSTDMNYIRFCISTMITSAVQELIKLLYTVLSYVNAITSAWFGINLFENASVDNFKKMQNGAKNTAKEIKEINKSTESFDEMNIMQKDSSSSSKNGTGTAIPSNDLNNTQIEIPKWLQWIIDNKDLIIGTLTGIAIALGLIKLGEFIEKLKELGFSLEPIIDFFKNHWQTILGVGIVLAGIILLIQSIIDYLNDPSWENFGRIITSIGVIILGLGIIIGNLPVIIAGVTVAILGIVASNWDKIKNLLQKAIDWIDNKMDWIGNNFGLLGQWVAQIFKGVIQIVLNIFDGLFKGIKDILDGIILIFKGNFKEGIEKIAKGLGNILIGIINGVTAGINAILYPMRALIAAGGKIAGKEWSIDNIAIPKIPLLAKGTVVSSPTPAIIGEAGAEAVVPLENNLDWLERLADMISSKIGGSGNVNVYLDSRLIQRQVAKRNDELAFATNR